MVEDVDVLVEVVGVEVEVGGCGHLVLGEGLPNTVFELDDRLLHEEGNGVLELKLHFIFDFEEDFAL